MKRIIKTVTGVALLALALLLVPAFFAGIAGSDYGRAYARVTSTVANASGPTNAGVALGTADTPQGGFGQAVSQPTNPSQAAATYALGQSCVIVYLTTQNPAAVAANATAEQDFTVTGVATGSVLAISKPTVTAGLGIVNVRAKAANTVAVTYINVTAGALDAGAENYWLVEFRGPLIQSTGTLTFTAVTARTTKEFEFDLTPGTGQQGVSSAHVADEPGTYALSPDLNTIDGSDVGTAVSSQQSTPSLTISPALDGNPQTIVINKPTAQADVSVANVRVIDNNTIGITIGNTHAADPVTATAEAYSFIALRGVSLYGDVIYGVNVGALAEVVTVTTPQQTVTVNGLATTDIVKAVFKPTDQAGIGLCESRVTAANTLGLKFVNPTAGGVTPTASEVYLVSVQKNFGSGEGAVLTQFGPALTSVAAVATITGAEQTFATVTGLVSAAPCVGLNVATGDGWSAGLGGALPPGLVVGGVRASAADTLAINLLNLTAGSITPGNLQVSTLQAQPDSSGSAAAAAGSFVAWPLNPQPIQMAETVNALQAALKKLNWLLGA